VPPNLECQDQGEEEANTAQDKVSGRTFELKLDRSKISRKRLELLLRFFLVAKWSTNYFILSSVCFLFSLRAFFTGTSFISLKYSTATDARGHIVTGILF